VIGRTAPVSPAVVLLDQPETDQESLAVQLCEETVQLQERWLRHGERPLWQRNFHGPAPCWISHRFCLQQNRLRLTGCPVQRLLLVDLFRSSTKIRSSYLIFVYCCFWP
jgi:hypothetical protein